MNAQARLRNRTLLLVAQLAQPARSHKTIPGPNTSSRPKSHRPSNHHLTGRQGPERAFLVGIEFRSGRRSFLKNAALARDAAKGAATFGSVEAELESDAAGTTA